MIEIHDPNLKITDGDALANNRFVKELGLISKATLLQTRHLRAFELISVGNLRKVG